MKRSIIAIFFLLVVISYKYNKIINNKQNILIPEKEKVIIDNYYIYGTNLNISGKLNNIDSKFKKADLILINDKNKLIYPINYTKGINTLTFNISDEINKGIYLDNIKKGTYNTYIRLIYKQKTLYYQLKNTTTYQKTEYYTLSKTNNKITINNNFIIKVKENKIKTYDIVIDPSHGGTDKGTIGNTYNEADITISFAKEMKKELEKKGIKVKLTRIDNSSKEAYNKHGRAIIPYEVHAKYLFSLHTNSSPNKNINGLSIYTPENINYDFSTSIVENITKNTTIKPANSNTYSIDYGIYTHNFTNKDIKESKLEYQEKGYKMYNITNNSNYFYMIRETGGIITGAYIDDRNKEIGNNPYYNSNVGIESYIIYLGYLTNKNDINMLTQNQKQYATILSNSIIKKLRY